MLKQLKQKLKQIVIIVRMDNMDNIVGEMMEMLEVISFNAGYIRYFQSPAVLNHPELYFDICKIIFPELNIKIVKIQEYKVLSPAENMQQLIDLLATQLKVNLTGIKGQQILRYNLPHIYNFLSLLYEYSKIFLQSNLIKFDVRSESAHIKRKQQGNMQPMSAREPQRIAAQKLNAKQQENNRNEANYKEKHEQGDYIKAKNNKTGLQNNKHLQHKTVAMRPKKNNSKAQYSAERKKARSMRQVRKNIHSSLVNTIMQQKTRMLRASTRDNRKNKMTDVQDAKREYKTYLQRYVKDNHAKIKRQQLLKSRAVSTQENKKPTLNDFKKIDQFFDSFQYKLLDRKAIYLRKMQKLVRRQELDRCCHLNKIERQTNKQLEDKLKADIQTQKHQYKVRNQLKQQQSKALQKGVAQMIREERILASQQKRQLKQAKRRQLEHIENVLKEDNERVLMSLEEGGRLQQIIMKMYKRF